MSQEAYNRFAPEMALNATLLYEADLIELRDMKPDVTAYGIPSTQIAEDLKRRMVANIVMVGFFASVTDLVAADALRTAVQESVPPGTEQLNLTAFDHGFKYGQALLKGQSPNAAIAGK
jgi:2-oxoglutarate ferredoxin oxidoreductase subunit gamma